MTYLKVKTYWLIEVTIFRKQVIFFSQKQKHKQILFRNALIYLRRRLNNCNILRMTYIDTSSLNTYSVTPPVIQLSTIPALHLRVSSSPLQAYTDSDGAGRYSHHSTSRQLPTCPPSPSTLWSSFHSSMVWARSIWQSGILTSPIWSCLENLSKS